MSHAASGIGCISSNNHLFSKIQNINDKLYQIQYGLALKIESHLEVVFLKSQLWLELTQVDYKCNFCKFQPLKSNFAVVNNFSWRVGTKLLPPLMWPKHVFRCILKRMVALGLNSTYNYGDDDTMNILWGVQNTEEWSWWYIMK